MAALVVTVSPANGLGDREGRIGIFPGGATTTMYPANTAFWVGYGFAADAASGDLDDATSRFELDVDGEPVSMLTDVDTDAGLPMRTDVAEFPARPPRRLARLRRALVRRRPPDPLEPRGDPVRGALTPRRFERFLSGASEPPLVTTKRRPEGSAHGSEVRR